MFCIDKKIHYLTFDLEAKVTQIVAQATVKYTFPICTCKVEAAVILLPAHPASFAHKFLFQRVPASPGMQ